MQFNLSKETDFPVAYKPPRHTKVLSEVVIEDFKKFENQLPSFLTKRKLELLMTDFDLMIFSNKSNQLLGQHDEKVRSGLCLVSKRPVVNTICETLLEQNIEIAMVLQRIFPEIQNSKFWRVTQNELFFHKRKTIIREMKVENYRKACQLIKSSNVHKFLRPRLSELLQQFQIKSVENIAGDEQLEFWTCTLCPERKNFFRVISNPEGVKYFATFPDIGIWKEIQSTFFCSMNWLRQLV